MSRYINHLNISANCYADNIEKAIELIEKSLRYKSDYEQDLDKFLLKGQEIHKVNRLASFSTKSMHEKKIRYKANRKVRTIIRATEKELFRIQKHLKSSILESVCTEFQVNKKIIKRIL
jgi:lipoate synthase